MKFFYLIFTLFCIIHTYIFIKLTQMKGRGKWQAFALAWFAAMLSVWWFRHRHAESAFLNMIMMVGFTWLGFSIIAACWLALFDLLALCRRGKKPQEAGARPHWLHPKRAVPLALWLTLISGGYAIYEAHSIRPYHVTIPTAKLPPGTERVRIAMVGDVHLSRFIGPYLLQKIAGIVNRAEPDIFISLGDLVDTDMANRHQDAAILRSITAPQGKFAILGNHEFYNGLANSLDFHNRAGLRLLRGQSVVAAGIRLIGVDDPLARKYALNTTHALPLLKAVQSEQRFILLLSHRPRINKWAVGLADLQASGHTHGGQIWPGSLLFRFFVHKLPRHLSEVRSTGNARNALLITNGAGYWGPPMRFLSPPEVVILDLVPETSGAVPPKD